MSDPENSDFRPEALDWIRRVGGEKLLDELVALFITAADERLRGMREAAEAGDEASVGRHCHALKSSAGQLGATRLQLTCAAIESRILSGVSGDLPGEMVQVFEAQVQARAWLGGRPKIKEE